MSFVIGIALTALSAGSPIFIEVLSTEDGKSSHSFQQEIIDPSNLTSTFEKIANSIPRPFASPITLACPSYLTEEEKDELAKLVSAVPTFSSVPVRARAVDNIHMTLVAPELKKAPYPPQIELALEVGPDAATARLISTLIEDDIRETTIEKEIVIKDIHSADLITQLVDPALTAIQEIRTSEADLGTYKVVPNDLFLKRVVIVDFSPTFVSSLIQELKSKFREFLPPVEFIVKNNLARMAADDSLYWYRQSKMNYFVYYPNPLRVGIVKADGFVSTAIARYLAIPLKKTVIFTTSQDQQATATIKVVVGIPPKGADNTVIAELVLKDLTRRPRGVPRIKVTFNVEQFGNTHIVAEELMDDDVITPGSTASIQLRDVIGDTLTYSDVIDIYAGVGRGVPSWSQAQGST